jgi:hypothetical protein
VSSTIEHICQKVSERLDCHQNNIAGGRIHWDMSVASIWVISAGTP